MRSFVVVVVRPLFGNFPFYPDLVLKKKGANEYAVFDAKFKRMTGRGGDVDREDLHQIHTYASYYEKKVC